MSKQNNTLLLVGAAAVAFYLWTRANTLNSLNFVPRGLGFAGGAAQVVLGVQNPTNTPISLNSLSGTLYVQGAAVGNVSDFSPIVIQPNSETPITLLVTANIFGLAGGALNALEGNETTPGLSASLVGTANINGAPLPVNIPLS